MQAVVHEHQLKLVDLQAINNEDVESDEEEKDLVTQDEFVRTCDLCGQMIHEYCRYYYICTDSCYYAIHKFCGELPTTLKTLKHVSHQDPLILTRNPFTRRRKCFSCGNHHIGQAYYVCPALFCPYTIDVNCAIEVDKRWIYHPSHSHPLTSCFLKPILCECSACGKEHKGVFFQCTTCSNFAIHNDCAFLPKSLLIQNTTNSIFHHTHPLSLSYSFTTGEQIAKYSPRCRVCDGSFFHNENLWVYKCEKCIYYAHLDCATSRKEPFMTILYKERGHTVKNFDDADYPNLLHLPFRDHTYSLPKHLFFKDIGPLTYKIDEVSLQHINHEHKLILVDKDFINNSFKPTSSKINSLIMCYDPMKKIEVLCNVCVRPITEMPFFKCGAIEDERCNFALHEWCTRLPTKIDKHPGHPQHTLVLMSSVPLTFFNVFGCKICSLPCNGYAYGCIICQYYVDVSCGFIPENITHKSHPNHLLSIVKNTPSRNYCILCGSYAINVNFSCDVCDVYIHPECAMFLPETIRHTYDKHPMHLSYLPIENHKSEYFCEICENELNPHSSFYHCDACAQSIHSSCAPLILQCETETSSYIECKSIYMFLNVKFGSIHRTDSHPHPLTFTQGIESDSRCTMCGLHMRYSMIFKCLECRFAIDYECCEGLNKS